MTSTNSTVSSGLRLIFAGTPDFAAHHLKALIEDGRHQIAAVYTQPDRPAGRGKKLKPSPVKQLALENELAVFQPQTLKSEEVQKELLEHQSDLMIVVAYGLILPQAVLDTPRFGCFNVHGSLLPRWRGAAPIQRAIAAGDKTSGVTIMQMDRGLDTGDMLYKQSCDIELDETSESLHDKLMGLGAEALLTTLEQLQHQNLKPEAQDDTLANYAEKITKEEARIVWTESAERIETKIRAYNPFPIAYTFLNEARIKIYQARVVSTPLENNTPTLSKASDEVKEEGKILSVSDAGLLVLCGEKQLLIEECQLPNKKRMSVAEIINGNSRVFTAGHYFE